MFIVYFPSMGYWDIDSLHFVRGMGPLDHDVVANTYLVV